MAKTKRKLPPAVETKQISLKRTEYVTPNLDQPLFMIGDKLEISVHGASSAANGVVLAEFDLRNVNPQDDGHWLVYYLTNWIPCGLTQKENARKDPTLNEINLDHLGTVVRTAMFTGQDPATGELVFCGEIGEDHNEFLSIKSI